MPNNLRFRVDAEIILVPELARLLMAFNAFYVAAALTDSERGSALAAQVRSGETLDIIRDALFNPPDNSKYFRALAALNAWPIGFLKAPPYSANPLRLTQIRSGSIEGVIEDILDSIFGRFSELLSRIEAKNAPALEAPADIGDMASDEELSNAVIRVATINAHGALHSLKASAVAVSERNLRLNATES